MAIFAEKGQGPAETVTGLSIIGAGMKVTGDLFAEGVIKVEGTVVGTVRAARQVLVAKGGVVEGDVFTREAIVGGEVRGGIQADERVEIQGTSVVHGDIATRKLFVQEGGEINGVIRMGEDVALERDNERRRAAAQQWAADGPNGSRRRKPFGAIPPRSGGRYRDRRAWPRNWRRAARPTARCRSRDRERTRGPRARMCR